MHRCKPIAIWKLTAFHYGSTPKGSPKTTAFTLPLPFITLPVMYFTLTMLTADTFLLPYLPEFLLTFRLIVIPVVKCAKFHVPKIQNTGYIYGQSLLDLSGYTHAYLQFDTKTSNVYLGGKLSVLGVIDSSAYSPD